MTDDDDRFDGLWPPLGDAEYTNSGKRTSSGCGGSVSFPLQLTSIDGLIRELIWLGASDV